MPSHFAHLLHAEDSLARAFPDLGELDSTLHSFLVLGAQGPDIFYHNRRRKPSALLYGSLSHRKNYGRVVAGMVQWSRERGMGLRSELGMYILGYLCHAVLDRKLHPFINYSSDLPDDRVFPRAHAFFERIVDIELLRHYRDTEARAIDFRSMVDCGKELPAPVEEALSHGFRLSFDRAEGDEELAGRLRNAYLDSLGFYGYTNMVRDTDMRRALEHAETEKRKRAFIALLHPPRLPPGYDFANRGRRRWCHPCDDAETRTDSLYDLYDDAVRQAERLLHGAHAGWDGRIPLLDAEAEPSQPSVEALVGNHNLSDERMVPCARAFSEPFPLTDIADQVAAGYS